MVVEVDPAADPRWDAFVSSHPDGLVYQHSAWLAALGREYGRAPIGLACEAPDGTLAGVLPLMRTRGLPVRGRAGASAARLSSLPRTPVAGPLGDARSVGALVEAARARAARERVPLQLKPRGAPELRGLAATPWRDSYVVALPATRDELRFGGSRNHSRIRWAVNKAEKAGVRVREAAGEADLRAWYALYLDTMRTHVVPPRPYRFFAALRELLEPRGLMRLLLAEHDSSPIGGSLFLGLGSTLFYAFNGRRADALALRPNEVIMWRAIHDACAAGYRRFDLGEVPRGNEQLAEFKRKWGAEPVTLWRYHAPETRSDEADEAAGALVTRLWRRLPLRATELVGDRVYAYL